MRCIESCPILPSQAMFTLIFPNKSIFILIVQFYLIMRLWLQNLVSGQGGQQGKVFRENQRAALCFSNGLVKFSLCLSVCLSLSVCVSLSLSLSL